MPSIPDSPIICVGPGTGVAPLRALIGHRRSQGIKGQYMLKFYAKHLSSLKIQEIHYTLVVDQPQKINTMLRNGPNK